MRTESNFDTFMFEAPNSEKLISYANKTQISSEI
jgi:hypothetical protein